MTTTDAECAGDVADGSTLERCRETPVAAGCRLEQDGDGEGSVSFDINDDIAARTVIRAVGARRRRVLTSDELVKLAAARAKSPLSAPRNDDRTRGKGGGGFTAFRAAGGRMTEQLGPYQATVARLVAQGLTDKQIAATLGRSEGTVATSKRQRRA